MCRPFAQILEIVGRCTADTWHDACPSVAGSGVLSDAIMRPPMDYAYDVDADRVYLWELSQWVMVLRDCPAHHRGRALYFANRFSDNLDEAAFHPQWEPYSGEES